MPNESIIQDTAYTIDDYLCGCVNFPVNEELVRAILVSNEVQPGTEYSNVEEGVRKLCEAKLYEKIATSPSRMGEVSDSDNSWRHTEGGYSFSKADRAHYLSLANAIYDELDMPHVGGVKVRSVSYGIRRADYCMNGMPLPHIIK